MTSFVRVTDDEEDEAIEIPAEEDSVDQDGTLLLSSLIAQFPGACGLKYRADTGGLRGVRLASGSLHPPNGFWGNTTYIVNFPKAESKRKGDEEIDNPVSTKMKKMEVRRPSDLIVLGLPWKSNEDDMKEYFKQFGELVLVQVKRDVRSGQSKGFGFIRFSEYDAQLRCLAARHRIDGRWCEVNLPNSHNDNSNLLTNRKIFVARCTEDITNEDLKEYFEEFGEVTDTFIPKPFRAFAFVTFTDPLIAQRMCGEDHIIKGASVHISSAEPKGKDSNYRGDRNMGGRGGNQRMREESGGNWSQQNQRQMQQENVSMEQPPMNNIGMNMLSSAMLAAAQAVFSGQNPNATENYQLGPGFGGTRDSRSSWGGANSSGDNAQGSNQSSYSSWGNKSGSGGGGYSNSSSSQQWGGQGQGSRSGGWS